MNNNISAEAARLSKVKFSPVRRVLAIANEMQAQGREIIHFEIGEPDFDTPDLIVENTIKALRNKKTHYASNLGDLGLRKKVAERLLNKSNIVINPNENILITIGAAEAIFDGIMATVNEGDEVILFNPAFMFYKNIINMAGGKIVETYLKPENNFQINIDELAGKITDKTKMIVLNNPHNPTGMVFDKESLQAIGELAVKNNILILSDEIYDEIVYDGIQCYSLASDERFKDNVIVVNGFSKAYAMTGWRLGYIVAQKDLIQAILKVHQYTTTCISTFIQIGAAESMNEEACLKQVEHMRKTFEKRRDILVEKAAKIKGIKFVPTKGAFYMLLDISSFGLTDEEFATKLLEEKGVATVPASGFSEDFKNHIRISFATSEDQILKGLEKLHEFCDELSGRA